MAKSAFDQAISGLDKLPEASYKSDSEAPHPHPHPHMHPRCRKQRPGVH